MNVREHLGVDTIRFLTTSYNIMSWDCPCMFKCSQILAFLAAFVDMLPWTLLQNAQVNKASSVNKKIVKTCLIVDMVRKNWSWIGVASCGLNYFVSAANFTTAEKFKNLFFTAMKIHTMARIVKKQNNFIFSSLVT